MKKYYRIIISFFISIVTFMNMATFEVFAEINNSINSFIYNMDYDKQEILTQDGEKITNVPPTQSRMEDGKFTVIKREKQSISNNSADISVINSNNFNIYAGAILKGDKGLIDNNPTVVAIPRDKITLSIDLPGMAYGDSHTTVLNPTNSTVRDGINKLLETWNSKYSSSYPNIPARIEYNESMAYSMAQLKTKFGTSFEKLAVPLNLNFEAVNSGEKQVMIVNFKQIYYTVGVDAPSYPSELFSENVTVEDLKQRGLSSETPPVYVSDVSYGRSIFVKLETDSKSTQFKGAVNAAIKGIDISNNTDYQEILKNTSFTAVVLGGDAGSASNIVSGNIDDLKEIIKKGACYNNLNPGVPISYTTRFVKDNSPATISSYSEYIKTTFTTYNNGYIKLDNSGAYVARFYVEWDELSYDEEGKEIWEHKSWEKNGWNFTSHWSEIIQIPANAHNLHIVAQECTGLAWEWWRTVYDKKNIPLVKQRNITLYNTTLYPLVSEEVLE